MLVDAATPGPQLARLAPLLVLLAGCATPSPRWRADLCGDPDLRARPPDRQRAPAPRDPTTARTRNVVLVTLDGVRWQEVFEGVDPALAASDGLPQEDILPAARLLPSIHRYLISGGVALGAPGHGETVSASGPEFVSLPGYLELFTGRPSGCRGNHCAPVGQPTLLDEVRAELALPPEQVAAIASWEKIARAASVDGGALTVSAGRHGGTSRERVRAGRCASALLDAAADSRAGTGFFDYRSDRYTARIALDYLEATRPRLLFVGLGDTDEHAHLGDYGSYLASLRFADRFLGALFERLAAMGDYGAETTVIVTADHGRAYGFAGHGSAAPESARVFLLAAGGAIPARGRVAAPAPRHLADVAPTVRALLGLPLDLQVSGGSPLPELLGHGVLAGGSARPTLAAH